MGFGVNNYMKVWSIERFEKYSKVNISSSKKNKMTGEYDTDFSGYATLIGKAHKEAESIEANDRIKILSCDVTTRYDKAKNEKYTNFTIFDFEPAGSPAASIKNESNSEPAKESEESDDELPF